MPDPLSSAEELLALARELLALGPSQDALERILALLQDTPPEIDAQTVLEYVQSHLDTWPAERRIARPTRVWPAFPSGSPLATLSLVRVLDLKGRKLRSKDCEKMASCEALSALEGLLLDDNLLTDEGLLALAQSQHLAGLKYLFLYNNGISDEGVDALVESPYLKHLERLELGGNKITDEGVATLAACEHLGAVTSLALGANKLTGESLKALLDSPHLAALKHLDLSRNKLGPEGLLVCTESQPHFALESLCLHRTLTQRDGVVTLLQSPLMATLQELDLSMNYLGPGLQDPKEATRGLLPLVAGCQLSALRSLKANSGCEKNGLIQKILENPTCSNLQVIALENPHSPVIETIIEKPQLSNLESLTLTKRDYGTSILDSVWSRLTHCEHLSQLHTLSLASMCMQDDATRALVEGEPVLRPKALDLSDNGTWDKKTLELFAASPLLSQIEALDLSDRYLPTAGFVEFLKSPHLAGLRSLSVTLSHAPDEEETLSALASCTHLDHLEELKLQTTTIPMKELLLYLTMPHAEALQHFELRDCSLSPAQLESFLQSPSTERLRTLRLVNCKLTDKAFALLSQSPQLHQLHTLDISHSYIKKTTLRLLQQSPHLQHAHILR